MASRIRSALLVLAVLVLTFVVAAVEAPHPGITDGPREVAGLPLPPVLDGVAAPEPTNTPLVPVGAAQEPTRTLAFGETPAATTTPAPTLVPQPQPVLPAGSLSPTRIQAPAIGLDGPVVPVTYKIVQVGGKEATSWVVPINAAGFHMGSAYPGEVGNTVISGHHNMGTEVFKRVIDLKVGDEIILWVGDKSFHYKVSETHLLQEAGATDEQRLANGRWIAPTQDERLTLVTCWPYSGNSHRVIVVALPVR
ncbi:MAG: sortase [Anaerolineae bacterium]